MGWGLQLKKLKINREHLNSNQSKTTMIPKHFETIVFAVFSFNQLSIRGFNISNIFARSAGEMAVIIRKSVYCVCKEDALDYVDGYSMFNHNQNIRS